MLLQENYINLGQAGSGLPNLGIRGDYSCRGCGSNGCERNGGTVIVLGKTGDNFGAGMTGGMAFIYDEDKEFNQRVNAETLIFDTTHLIIGQMNLTKLFFYIIKIREIFL